MTRLSPRHPRYRSLRVRAGLAEAFRQGIVVPEGLIAHGRGEAFDYLLGERTIPSARRAERVAAAWLLAARRPVLSVNGNVAALAAPEVAALGRALPHLAVEVNLFHRTPARARAIAARLRAAGVPRVLGVRPTARIPGLPSDRAWVDREGIARADLCVIPLEDGDRAAALRRLGKKVVAIDLNPLSRTARTAHLTIVDELTRALTGIATQVAALRRRRRVPAPRVSNADLLRAAEERLRGRTGLAAAARGARTPRRPTRSSGRPR